MQNPIILITGPAGVGKTTIANRLKKEIPQLKSSVTYTTREERKNAKEDKIIHYVDKNDFKRRIDNNEFLEWAKVHGNYYGTHAKETRDLLSTNPVIFNIDIQGVKQILEQFSDDRTISIFIAPESFEQIENHLQDRYESNQEEIKTRMGTAQREMEYQHDLDYRVVNYENKLEDTIERIKEIIEPHILDKTAK